MQAIVIGTGRLAFHLGHAFKRAGIDLLAVVGREPHPLSQSAPHLPAGRSRVSPRYFETTFPLIMSIAHA